MSAKQIAPRITQKPSLKQFESENKLQLNCEIQASPKPEIKWYRDSIELRNSSKIKINSIALEDNNLYSLQLEINDLIPEDSGVYKVVAKNGSGETSATITLNFSAEETQKSILDGIAPNFLEKPIIKSDTNGKRLCFECKIKSDPEPLIKWYHGQVEISDKGRHLIYCDKLSNDTYFAGLEIDDVSKADAGKYTIHAKNALGESTANISLNFETEESENSGKPIFTDKPKIRHLDEKILFECHLTSDLVPQISWEYNKMPLNESSKIKTRIQSSGSNHVVFLELTNVTARDSGTYVCTARNSHGESTCTINLQIESETKPPSTGIFPRLAAPPKITQTASSISINLEIEARPMPNVIWYKETQELISSQKIVTKFEQKSRTDSYELNLEIKDAQINDAGLYKCVLENELGQFTINTNLTVQANKLSSDGKNTQAPSLVEKPTIKKDESKKSLRIECRFKARPDVGVIWLKGKETLKADAKYKFSCVKDKGDIFVATLDISNLSESDAGNYKCQAKNEAGQSNVLIHLDVDTKEKTSKPKLNPPKITRENGSKLICVEIECESGDKPEVQWTGPLGKLLPNEGRFFHEVVSLVRKNVFKIILEIDDATTSDAGLYTCHVQNKSGETSITVEIKIEEVTQKSNQKAPSFVEKPKDQVVFDGDKVTVTCKVQGTPQPEIKWLRNKKPIEKSKDFDWEFNGEVGKLTINDAYVEDSGDYSCIVASSAGQQVANFRVAVKEKKGKMPRKRQQKKDLKGAKKAASSATDPIDFRSLLKHRNNEKNKKQESGIGWGDLRHVDNENEATDQMESSSKPESRKMSRQEIPSKRNSVLQQGNEIMYETEGPKRAPKQNQNQDTQATNERKMSTQPLIKLDLIDEKLGRARQSVAHSERKVKEPLAKHDGPLAPVFLEKPENKIIAEGATDFIEAQIDGFPFPNVTWEKGMRPCVEGAKFTFEKNQDTGVVGLIVHKAKSDDEAKYTLKISNEHGEEKAVFSVFVKSSKDDSADFRSLLKHREHNKIKEGRDSVDWGDLKHVNKDGESEIEQDGTGSKSSSRRNSIIHRSQLRHVDQEENSLKIRRDSTRRTSLVNLIPDWPTLHAVKIAAKEPEKFIKILEDINAKEEDGNIKFECEFCKPGGKLRWYKQKAEVFHGLKYHVESDGAKHTLIVNKLNVEDSGKYICNVNGIETFAYLKVEPSKPKFEFLKKLPSKLEVFRTKQALLECFVNHEDCTPQWYKGNELLTNDTRYRIIKEKSGRCTLKIANTRRDDETVFTCKINDEECTSCYVYVEEPDFKFIRKLPSKLEANEGREVELDCEIEDAEAECSWFINGKALDPKENPNKYQVVAEGLKRRLIIKNPSPKEAGKYECKCGLTITSCELSIKENLKIVKNIKGGEVLEETQYELVVEINKLNGKPVWYRNGKMINFNEKQISEKFSTTSQEYTHKLIFKKVDLKDAGEYEVRFDKVIDKCNLTVKECEKVPKVDLSKVPKKLKLKAGRELALEVPYEACPEPNMSWKKNGDKIDSNGSNRSKMSKENKVASLKIDKAQRGDSGKYELILSNAKGETKIPIEIEILDKPGVPQGPLDVSEVTTSSVVLSWRPPIDDGGSPVTSYIIEKLDAVRDTWSAVDTINGDVTTYKVNKLTAMKEYQFRVRAANSEGEGLNLETVHKILAKYPFDEPEAPSIPEIVDWSNEKVDLKWNPPQNDGGSPVEKYIIERCEKGKQWQKVNEISGDSTEATVLNLSEGRQYEFRIIAVNKAGPSTPSEPSKLHLVKHRFLKPRIDKNNLKQITIKATLTLNIEVPFVGEPLPTCEWSHNGISINSNDRILVTTVEKIARITIKDCKRSDGGKYTIRLTNSSGYDTTDVEVVVLAAPAKPKGPLEIKDIKKDSVSLVWSKPEDDGGKPIQSYIVQKKLKNSDVWETVSEMIPGESFTIKNLKEGQEYEFRVLAENVNGVGDPLVVDKPILVKSPYTVPSAPQEPQCISRSEKYIEIGWKKPYSDGGMPIKGYIVERREKNGKKWIKLTKEPIKETNYIDEKVLSRKEYEFRVYAVNEEGQSEPSSASSIISAKPEKEKPQIARDSVVQEIKIRAGEPINIHFPITGFPVPTVAVDKQDGVPNRACESKDEIKFEIDEEKLALSSPCAKRSDTGNYLIKLENSEGSDTIALKLNILDRPGQCEGPIEVTDSSKTSISLKWNSPKDDGGAEVTGFIIEKKIDGTNNWETCLTCTQPQATIKGLPEREKFSFRVRAVNMYGEGDNIETKTPITVKPPYNPPDAPEKPELVESHHGSIKIHWKKPLNDGGNPVSGYLVEMRKEGTNEWVQCNRSPIKGTEFNATGLEEGQHFEFRVLAVNDMGAGEPSLPTDLRKAEPPTFAPSSCDNLNVDEISKDSVTLSWRKPLDDGGVPIEGFLVEKKSHDGDWIPVSEIGPKETSCSISGTDGEEAQFRISAKNSVGYGEPSKPTVPIKFENQIVRPSFDMNHAKDVIVKAHEKFEVHIPYKGFPKPTLEVLLNDEELKPNDRIEVIVSENVLSIINHDAMRGDHGNYKVILRNTEGSTYSQFRVRVNDVPSIPGGPLEVLNITPESCSLKWKEPNDNGGNEVTNYIVEKREVGGDKWTRLRTLPLENSCQIKGLEEGKQYEFRVAAENTNGISEYLNADASVTAKWQFSAPGSTGVPKCLEHTENSLLIGWNKPKNDGGDLITSYIVEKREEGTEKWLTVGPTNETSMMIKGCQDGKKYEVRVAALNRAGKGPWSTCEEAFEARPADSAPKVNSYFSNREITIKVGESLKLVVPFEGSPRPTMSWKKGDHEITENDKTCFHLSKYTAELHTHNTTSVDGGYYTCFLANKLGEDMVTFKVIVLDKPTKPDGPIEAININTDGCTLRWNPPKYDGGSTVTNYIIEKMDLKFNEWVKVSSFCRKTEFEFIDLEENHSYKFRVYAENSIGKSDFLESNVVVIKNPLPLPDAPTGLIASDIREDSLLLQWNPTGEKFINYAVEIKVDSSDDWVQVNTLPIRDSSFFIGNLEPGLKYSFRVKAKNSTGYSLPSKDEVSVTLKPALNVPETPNKPIIKKIGRKFAEIGWEANKDKIIGYIVEKKLAGLANSWQRVNTYPFTETESFVSDLMENENYEFRIKAINKRGESEPSESTGLVKITEYPDGKMPEFTKLLKNVEASIGFEAHFEVEFTGNPHPDVKWFKNGLEIYSASRYTIVSTGNSSKLIIKELWESNNNNYISCNIENPLGKASCEATLHLKEPPKVEKEPGDQQLELGSNLRLKIPITGKGPFKFDIKMNDNNISNEDARVKIDELDGVVLFSISNTNKDDNGKYTIRISNDSGSTECSFKLKIRGPPSVPQGPLEPFSIRKTHCKLKWTAPNDDGGAKITHYTIEKKDLTVNGDWVPYYETFKDTRGQVKGLIENHEYLFRVLALNEIGTSEPLVSERITAKLDFPPPCQPNDLEVRDIGSNFISFAWTSNDKVNLTWTRPNNHEDATITGYYIEKREKGSDKWVRCNQSPITSNSFTISNLIEDNEYEFRVFAENEAGLSPPSNTTPFFRIRNPNALPEFFSRISDCEAVEGQSANFECEIQGEVSRVQWLKNGQEIYDSGKYTLTQDGQKYRMTINNVTMDDDADYSVRIYNQNGNRTSKASLTVQYRPRIKLPSRYISKVTFKKGDTITLKIPYTANPKPEVIWKLNDIILTGYEVECSSYYATIVIKNATPEHSGIYKLKLENEVGSDSCEIQVQILNSPSPPTDLHAEQLSHESVKLTWQPPVDDGGSDVTNYIVEKCDYSSVRSTQIWSVYGKTHTCYMSVFSLLTDQRYQFRITAENFIGRSLSSEIVSFEFKIEVPRKKSTQELRNRSNRDYTIPDDYDKCFHDLWSKPPLPSPILFKTSDVNDEYDILEEIGRGAFGVVHRAIERKSGKTFAAKFVPTPDAQSRNLIKRECEMMNQLINPKLLNLHDYFDNGNEAVLITEFLAGGELFNRLADKNFVMTEEEAKIYIRQICLGLRYMHENNIVHLDIKPENILFETKSSQNLKLVDFGLAAKLDPEEEVKVTSATIEFSAPEIVTHEPVGFFTDMWSVGVLTFVLLSGLSPFCGRNDEETSENIKNSDLSFPQCFSGISENAKDFIKRLLVKQKTGRMNVFDALNHPWLKDDETLTSSKMPYEIYEPLRDRIQRKYNAYPEPRIGIGRIAQFSSLKKQRPSYYSIYSTFFDRREAAPRFILKPRNQHVIEGQTAEFKAIIVAPSQPLISWYRDGNELKQSTKHMKRYSNSTYLLEVKKCGADDRGEYILKASNSYGDRECVVFLTVDLLPQPVIIERPERHYERRRIQQVEFDLWREADLKPTFTFLLRPRLIQEGIGVKFLCVVSGRPTPKITWYKENSEIDLNDSHYTIAYDTGVCTLEIVSCHINDAGTYSCKAENELGSDITSCNLIVEECKYKDKKPREKIIHSRRESVVAAPLQILRLDPPRLLTKLPPVLTKFEGESTSLECSFDGAQTTINWTKNQQTLLDDRPRTKLIIGRKDTKFVIESLTIDDSGDYECKVLNNGGNELSKCRLEVTKKDINLKYEQENNDISLQCEPEKMETKSQIENNTKIDQSLESLHEIIENQATIESIPLDKSISSIDSSLQSSNDLGFIEHLRSKNLLEGQVLTLECKVYGPEPLSVLWLRNYKEIPENPDFFRERIDNVFRLIVSEIFPEDSGVFSAILISGASPLTRISTCSIIVKANDEDELDPQFNLFPLSATLAEGTTAHFECELKGSDPVSVKWFKDNIEITDTADRFKFSIDKQKLEIQAIESNDDGNYRVIASNSKGEINADFHLNVNCVSRADSS